MAKSVTGIEDLSEEWLIELWDNAKGDANRALNQLLDTAEEEFKREEEKPVTEVCSESAAEDPGPSLDGQADDIS